MHYTHRTKTGNIFLISLKKECVTINLYYRELFLSKKHVYSRLSVILYNTMVKRVALYILLMLSPFVLNAQKVGLVMSGGGARGLAHIGVIKVLEENNIPCVCIEYAGVDHGIGIGKGLPCEGWFEKAVAFWEEHRV